MPRAKMTTSTTDSEPTEEVGKASPEEVKEKVKGIAGDVAKEVATPKPLTASDKKKLDAARSRPERDSDPLQGATIDPDRNYPKILNLLVTVGDDDERSMDEFLVDVKEALEEHASTKHVTALLQKYQVDGKHILSHHYDRATSDATSS